MPGTVYVLAVACAAALSLRARTAQIQRAYEAGAEKGIEPRPSHLSKAVEETLATAAGIYIALSALTSFLKVSIPPVAILGGLSVDPVPALAIVLALAQPLFGRW